MRTDACILIYRGNLLHEPEILQSGQKFTNSIQLQVLAIGRIAGRHIFSTYL